jgi:hypothetical protein
MIYAIKHYARIPKRSGYIFQASVGKCTLLAVMLFTLFCVQQAAAQTEKTDSAPTRQYFSSETVKLGGKASLDKVIMSEQLLLCPKPTR